MGFKIFDFEKPFGQLGLRYYHTFPNYSIYSHFMTSSFNFHNLVPT